MVKQIKTEHTLEVIFNGNTFKVIMNSIGNEMINRAMHVQFLKMLLIMY